MNKVFQRITNRDYVERYNETDYSTDEFINHVTNNKQHIEKSFSHFVMNKGRSVDEFCIFLLKSLKKQVKHPSYTILPNINSRYQPEYLMININKPTWVLEEVTSDKYERRLNIYQSPLYNNDNLRFLPNQTVGHRRPYDKPYFANAIELTQEPKNKNIGNFKLVQPPNYDNSTVFKFPIFIDVLMKHRHIIPEHLYKKIIRNHSLSIFDYKELKKHIREEEIQVLKPFIH